MSNHPCANKCDKFKNGEQCMNCLINETVNRGVYSMHRTEHQIDHIVEPNDMVDSERLQQWKNNIPKFAGFRASNLSKNESQDYLAIKTDAQIIAELKAENKMLHEAASTHLKNQMHFKKLYDTLVEQLYPYALDLNVPPNFSFKNCSRDFRLGFVAGDKTASKNASLEILEMLKSNEEYIRAQCDMLGGEA